MALRRGLRASRHAMRRVHAATQVKMLNASADVKILTLIAPLRAIQFGFAHRHTHTCICPQRAQDLKLQVEEVQLSLSN